MAVVEVHPELIDGPWVQGLVLDRHVIASRPIGLGQMGATEVRALAMTRTK
jgi:hypothetical protein